MKRYFILGICFFASTIFSEEKIAPEDRYYSQVLYHFKEKNWQQVQAISHLIYKKFPHHQKISELYYYWAVSCYHLKDYAKANEFLTLYLELNPQPKNFEEVIQYKFAIAEKFRQGEKSHLFGWNAMPRWMPSGEVALEIYDEVVASLPHHELAARSLYGKAVLLAYYEDFKDSIDALRLVIQRFPKHDLAPESFLEIGKVYLAMANSKQQDPTLIDQSSINLNKFRMVFPLDERVNKAEVVHNDLQGAFAENLYDMAAFFMKRKKSEAASLYYKKILSTFPGSEIALKASEELERLDLRDVQ